MWTTKPPLGTQLDWSHPLNQGLVGFWVFNEGMGDKVYDLSGNGNTGTLTNIAFPSTPTSGWNPGRAGPSIAFDGSNDYIDLGNASIFNPLSSSFSFEIFFRTDSINVFPLSSRSASATQGYEILTGGGGVENAIVIRIGGSGIVGTQSPTWSAPDNQWNFVAGVIDRSTERLYIYGNGASMGYTDITGIGSISNTQNLMVGLRATTYYPGMVDEVRIWNRILSSTEMATLYLSPYEMFLEECPSLICSFAIE